MGICMSVCGPPVDNRQYRMYIGCGTGEIHCYDIDADTGEAKSLGKPLKQDGSGSFLVPFRGKYLFAVAKPGMASFEIDSATGELKHINTVKNDIPGNSHIEVYCPPRATAGILMGSAYGGGGVNVVKFDPSTGTLRDPEPNAAVQHLTGSDQFATADPKTGQKVQDAPHCHSAFVDPAGSGHVLVSDLGADAIISYKINDGLLTKACTLRTGKAAGPRHLCYHPRKAFVYALHELDCTVTVHHWKGREGNLSFPVQRISTLPQGYDNSAIGTNKNAAGSRASGPNRPGQTNSTADIHATPDGRFLYASNRGHDSLVCYEIQYDGKLKVVGWTYTRGEHPRNFGIHPSGKLIVVANQDSNNLSIFKVEKTTGALTPLGNALASTKPRCVKFVAVPTTGAGLLF